MTPAPRLDTHANRHSTWPDLGELLAEAYRPVGRPVPFDPREARMLRLSGRLHRLLAWLTRPVSTTAGNSADAVTRLEILSRGGFPR